MAKVCSFFLCFVFIFGCKDRQFNSSTQSAIGAPSPEAIVVPPPFPDASSVLPWGGRSPESWKPEALFANAIGKEFNLAWRENGVVDVLVAVPTRFEHGNFNPYGDGQINASMGFNSAWPHKRPQMLAVLKHYASDKPSRIFVRFDRALLKQQNEMELLLKESANAPVIRLTLPSRRDADGDLVAEIDAPGSWNLSGKSAQQRYAASAGVASALIRPLGQFDDWFPLTFRHPVTTTERLIDTVGSPQKIFPSGSGVMNPAKLDDPVGLRPESENENAFANALGFEIDKKWPAGFNNGHYPACNVHGVFAYNWNDMNAQKFTPTAVGRSWAWLTNPTNSISDSKQGPFKMIYTCFEPRRAVESTAGDATCRGQANEGIEAQHGVPTGAGWHLIGDPAETILNSLEKSPMMMAAGFSAPHERIALVPPDHGMAFGLNDVAVARWLMPGESFSTTRSKDPSRPNFHWFLFHGEEHACIMIWVHHCVPDDQQEPQFGGTACK